MSSARGGARPGAGRKPALDPLERLDIGTECETRWMAIIAARQDAAIAAHTGPEYAAIIEEVHRVPLDERAGWHATYEGEEHVEAVEEALRSAQGIDPTAEVRANRLATITVLRPYRAKAPIEAAVAVWATEKFGRSVSIRTVQSCWSELRQLQARLAAD